jgi:hypothetical protein
LSELLHWLTAVCANAGLELTTNTVVMSDVANRSARIVLLLLRLADCVMLALFSGSGPGSVLEVRLVDGSIVGVRSSLPPQVYVHWLAPLG